VCDHHRPSLGISVARGSLSTEPVVRISLDVTLSSLRVYQSLSVGLSPCLYPYVSDSILQTKRPVAVTIILRLGRLSPRHIFRFLPVRQLKVLCRSCDSASLMYSFMYNQQDASLYSILYCCQCSTCFRTFLRQSSEAQKLYTRHRVYVKLA
jgi:hypothetical protein